MSNVRSLATLAFCFGSAMGHMIMQNPVPFGKSTLNNSPLNDEAIGSAQSDFPCKQRTGVYDITQMNKYAVETPIELNFTGSASHGGGTCQISVTRDLKPTAQSDFRVIQTFSGGCPTSSDGGGSSDFTFTIPRGFPNGRATLAWTWYNKIGNREIYMNCAPLDISGGSSNTDVFDALPHMYVINLPTTGSDYCKSTDSADVLIPDPGANNLKASTANLQAPTGPGCAAAAKAITQGVASDKGSSSGGDSNQTAATSSQSQASSPSSESQAPASSSSAASASGFSTVTTVTSDTTYESATASSADSTSFPTMAVSSDAGVSGPASTGFAAAPTATGSSSSSTGSSSSSDGSLVCNGTSQFGLVNNGKVVWQSVAPGTKCVNGQIQKRADSRHAHVRRHAAKDF